MPDSADRADDVLSFWFGELDERGGADQVHSQRWWRKDDAFDDEIRARFGALHEAVAAGQREDWLRAPRSRLAYVIVLDQFSRNMFRGSPGAFAQDTRALQAAREGVRLGEDRELAFAERPFLYMPFMHSEDPEDQDRSVALFTAWRDQLDGPLREQVDGQIGFAERHRDIVRRFGRFPHRNQILGRRSTAEELEFLQQPGSSF